MIVSSILKQVKLLYYDLLSLLQFKFKQKKPLLLVARDVDDKVLSWLILENSEINVSI